MKKLSSLSDDTMICWGRSEDPCDDFRVTTVKDFLDDETNGVKWVAIAEREVAVVDASDITDRFDDMYEDWDNDVQTDPDFQAALKALNKALADHPSYHEGEAVEWP